MKFVSKPFCIFKGKTKVGLLQSRLSFTQYRGVNSDYWCVKSCSISVIYHHLFCIMLTIKNKDKKCNVIVEFYCIFTVVCNRVTTHSI